ncbi:uncharacterized protein LOC100858497 [Gallus gallus]|uniref:uncharacterized protein LOC100858497 n=1 Tax=Gallus gallus TaxID=9031 RepID=UPI001AEB62B6|nr:uncharacterized protein LOC100858497 [Gallus gallus]
MALNNCLKGGCVKAEVGLFSQRNSGSEVIVVTRGAHNSVSCRPKIRAAEDPKKEVRENSPITRVTGSPLCAQQRNFFPASFRSIRPISVWGAGGLSGSKDGEGPAGAQQTAQGALQAPGQSAPQPQEQEESEVCQHATEQEKRVHTRLCHLLLLEKEMNAADCLSTTMLRWEKQSQSSQHHKNRTKINTINDSNTKINIVCSPSPVHSASSETTSQ